MRRPLSDQLPRLLSRVGLQRKCQALHDDGSPCGKAARYEISFHGDPEMTYGEPLSWVRVVVCDKHLSEREARKLDKRLRPTEGGREG